MTRLTDKQLFEGQTETITVSDFRKAPGDIIAQVQMGMSFQITKNGKLVAVLAQPEPAALQLGAALRANERWAIERRTRLT